MATNTGKGKKKGNKPKGIPLQLLLAEEKIAPQGFNVVNTGKLDWAESMEDDLDDTFTLNYKRNDTTKVLLPTAPKATRGPDIDMNRVPTEPPFKAYLGNLPYDVTQSEITQYFNELNLKDVRLPYNGRQKGFAYAEFGDRQSLIDALTMNGNMFRNRQLKVGLSENTSDNNSRDNNREERTDRTAGDWRSTPREETGPPREMTRDSLQSGNSRNESNDYSYSDKSMQRSRGNDSGGYGRQRYDNDRTFKPSTDRGFDRSNNYSNDRGFERNTDRGFDRNSDRGFERSNDRGFDRPNDRGFDRPNNRYGNRYNDRTDGFDDHRDRDHGYESNERSYGRRNDDSNRYQNRNFSERRTEGRREFGEGFDSRRGDDSQYESRNTSSPPPTHDVSEGHPKERPKLQLKPRSKPIEASTESATANSAIFGGAKPVDTAAREQEIEQKLLKEREESDKKRETSSNERIRRISTGSNVSGNSRSRKGSDSGPPGSRDSDDNYRNSGSHRNSLSRQRKTSERSDRSNGINDSAPKYLITRGKDHNSAPTPRIVSVRDTRPDAQRGNGATNRSNSNNNNNNRRRDRDRENRADGLYRPPRMNARSDDDEEERKAAAYTTSNKFAHLPNEDYDEEDGTRNASD